MKRSRARRTMRVTDAEKAAVIERAGPHRTVEFFFERSTDFPTRGRLVCTRVRIPAAQGGF